MTSPFSHLTDQVTLDAPWSLVEAFSTMPRWKPEDVKTAAQDIAKRLDDLGVPYEMLNSNLHLSIPFTASVSGGGETFNAKPPPMRAIVARG